MLKAAQFEILQGGTKVRLPIQRDVNYFESYRLDASISTPSAEDMQAAAVALKTEWFSISDKTLKAGNRAADAISRVLESLQRPPISLTADELVEAEGDSV